MSTDSQTEKYIRSKKWKKGWGEIVAAVFFAFICISIINQRFFFYVRLKDNSMENTLQQGCKIYFKRFKKQFTEEIQTLDIYRGQIVALNFKNIKNNPQRDQFVPFFQKIKKIVSFRFFFKNDTQIIVRRVVGISGDVVEIYKKKLFVNHREIIPSWKIKKEDQSILDAILSHRDTSKKILVPQGSIFVVCDNWDVFSDSRTLGVFSLHQITGIMYPG